ncbi:Gfo/Idh/MocA family oxidoreductase [Gammaproteobacteria bacterium]|nr:Gfo/Idh/MocA family oxidoreductase [Gammaproteobacteria bacterium]
MIRLGMIGMSEGNGHPYSWSAIINGYDPQLMSQCPFLAIPKYLSAHSKESFNVNAKVTSIWTQSKSTSKLIAESTFIENVEDNFQDMIPRVDGILLARDDYESHLKYAEPFLKAGLPIFIDKPMATDPKAASEILSLELFEGQIFSASSLAYDPRVEELCNKLDDYGELKFFHGIATGPWNRYAVHLIDPLIQIHSQPFEKVFFSYANNISTLIIKSDNLVANITCLSDAASSIKFTLHGVNNYIEVDFKDPFHAFKKSLELFTLNIEKKDTIRPYNKLKHSIQLISYGMGQYD